MAIPARQIGWGTEENLLWEISKQLDYLTKVTYNSKNITSTVQLGLDFSTIGPKVTFTKTNYGSEVDVLIPGVLEITRGANQGIYNAALQSGYDTGAPENTLWNSYYTDNNFYGWYNLTNAFFRNYDTWKNASNSYPPGNIGKELIMYETTTNRMWLIKFLEWTQNDAGGGFKYERYEVSPFVQFGKPNYETQVQDVITPNKTVLARNNQGPLYNSALEQDADADYSPLGTEWNSEYTDGSLNGWGNLANVRSRHYTPFVEACDGRVGEVIPGLELVMHDLATNLYWKFDFSEWTQNNQGGGFAYTRTLIPLDEAIIFADHTVQTTAYIP